MLHITNTTAYRVLFKLLVLAFLSLSLWVLSGSAGNFKQEEKYIPVQIIRQLETENALIPVEIQCGQAHLTAPNQLEGFDCRLKNNTSKNITAANVIYSIILEQNGMVVKDTSYSYIETFSESEFKGANKAIAPGEDCTLGPPGPSSYPDAVIKGVEIGIDYVEFENKTVLGPDEKGSQIIRGLREGAAKYRDWLTRKYNQNGKSVDPLIQLLQNDQPLPAELGPLNPNQELGAKGYRSRLRNINQNRGSSEVKKLLN